MLLPMPLQMLPLMMRLTMVIVAIVTMMLASLISGMWVVLLVMVMVMLVHLLRLLMTITPMSSLCHPTLSNTLPNPATAIVAATATMVTPLMARPYPQNQALAA